MTAFYTVSLVRSLIDRLTLHVHVSEERTLRRENPDEEMKKGGGGGRVGFQFGVDII